ncbi:MAG: 16S rRNA (guanine(527)-N(7))-methyltransferase RsmG [Alphaproteobacteria bacterium]
MISRVPGDIAAELGNVSRETLDRLEAFIDVLLTWQTRINLIGCGTIPDVWRRHVLDSAQLMPLIAPTSRRLVDVGSGAGFPGLVLAILGAQGVELVEASQKTCAFLAEAVRVTGAEATIVCARSEALPRAPADTVTARAVAPLPRLIELVRPLIGPGTRCLFLKGASVETELTKTHKMWKMAATTVPSRTDPGGRIVVIEDLKHGTRDHRPQPVAARSRHRQPEGRRR